MSLGDVRYAFISGLCHRRSLRVMSRGFCLDEALGDDDVKTLWPNCEHQRSNGLIDEWRPLMMATALVFMLDSSQRQGRCYIQSSEWRRTRARRLCKMRGEDATNSLPILAIVVQVSCQKNAHNGGRVWEGGTATMSHIFLSSVRLHHAGSINQVSGLNPGRP